jgi:hypothetical protein
MSRISLEFISGLAMPPIAFIDLAAELGCGGVSLSLAPFTANPHGYSGWQPRLRSQSRYWERRDGSAV